MVDAKRKKTLKISLSPRMLKDFDNALVKIILWVEKIFGSRESKKVKMLGSDVNRELATVYAKEKAGKDIGFIGFFIGVMVVVIVTVSIVLPTINDQVQNLNVTGAPQAVVTLLNMVPLFIVLAVLILVVNLLRF